MKAHPATEADADSSNLVFTHAAIGKARLFRPCNPYADTILTTLAFDVELGKALDDPLLKSCHEGAHVLAAAFQVEHHIGNALARSVIGIFSAASRVEDR